MKIKMEKIKVGGGKDKRKLKGKWTYEVDNAWADDLTDKEICEAAGLDSEQCIVFREKGSPPHITTKECVKELEKLLIEEIMETRNDKQG